jgi:catalase
MFASAAPKTLVAQIVETMRELAGSHPGFRPAHAKGIVCSGAFSASHDARRVSRAPHLQGGSVPTVIRFSNASGNPDVHDGSPSVRSLSVKFQLPDGAVADILANSIEGFMARTPEEFLEFLRAQRQIRPPASPLPMRCPSSWQIIPRRRPSSDGWCRSRCRPATPRRATTPSTRSCSPPRTPHASRS